MIKIILMIFFCFFCNSNIFSQTDFSNENIESYVDLEEVKKLDFSELKKLKLSDSIFKEVLLKNSISDRKIAVLVIRKDLLKILKEKSPYKYYKLIKLIKKLKLNENYYEFFIISENNNLTFIRYQINALKYIDYIVSESIL